MSRSRLPAAACAVACLISAGSVAAQDEEVSRRGPTASVDPALRAALAAGAGRTAAVVTTWSREGLAEVERLGIRGTRLKALPMLLVRSLTPAQLRALERSPAVRSVYANRKHRLVMEDTTWITKARYVWDDPGVTGAGVHVAVIDTGADGRHEDMDNLVEFCETQQAATSDHTTVTCSPFASASGNAGPAGATNDPRLDSTDDEGHGSHVSGTVAGSGDASGGRAAPHSTIGIAPDAKLHVYSANVGPALANHEILAAYDDLVHKKVVGLSEVVAVNNSWGGGSGYAPDDPQSVAFKAAYRAGIVSVFAAGNDGPEHDTLSRQCVSPWVVCVAASTKPDSVVMFSSRGRPSEPADTNRDGVVGGAGDVPPGNHDRALGQTLELGLDRPTLTAPGVNINAVSANAATCREGPTADSGCYEMLNGTSMATPHVTGAVALIVQAYRQAHGGETPTPAAIIDILERSAAQSKLPGYEAEEQGAGRLDVRAAVDLARTYPEGLPRPVFGTPSPPYAAGGHPGAPGTVSTQTGCTGTASWTLPGAPNPLDLEGPPVVTERYGQHVIEVGEKVERLRVTVAWPGHAPGTNLYVRLWRPGVDPDQETASPGQVRVFPDQEALGLLDASGLPWTALSRWLDVRAPEGSTLEEGPWTLRVYHRVGGDPALCDADSDERPKQTEGFNYTVTVEQPTVTEAPTVAIASTEPGGRFVEISGTASYPAPWRGVTTWEVPGSARTQSSVHADPDPSNPRTVLYFHGNVHAPGSSLDAGCTGDGRTDLVACSGPMLLRNPELSSSPAASWKGTPEEWTFDGASDRTIHDPSWVWCLAPGAGCPATEIPAPGPTTVEGAMTVEWWASCGPLCVGGGPDWFVRLWADGVLAFQQQVAAGPDLPNVPARVRVTVDLPQIAASQRLTLHVEPVFLLNQFLPFAVWYDSTEPCPGAPAGTRCDSLVRMPVGTSGLSGGGSAGSGPQNVRVTDAHSQLVLAWDPLEGATAYEVHRSTEPGFKPSPDSLLATTAGTACTSPDVPSWPSASRDGLCYADAAVSEGTTYYYRLVAVTGAGRTSHSLLAYGTPTAYDRQVRLKVDRLYGPQVWERATLATPAGTEWRFSWDTLELVTGDHRIAARSFTQGAGSAKSGPPVGPDDDGRVTFCHATGSPSKPYVVMSSKRKDVALGHLGADHQSAGDIVPPFEYRGETYSQNWPEGRAVWENGCESE